MTTPPPESSDNDSRALRLRCPHCGADYALWLRPEPGTDETLSPMEWECWLDATCGECGKKHRPAASRA